MKMIRTLLLLTFLMPILALASESAHMEHVKVDVTDKDALQKGAKYFFNYCAGCHSIHFSSYKRIAKDLGLTEQQVEDNFMMSYGDEKKISNYVTTSMTVKQGKALFEKAPPDLSTISRAKGDPSWLYSYLTSFYMDESRPFGVNNLVFKNVGMPHAMIELQGYMNKVEKDVNGKKVITLEPDPEHPGRMKEAEYKQAVKELVTFLAYIGEPSKTARHRLGVWVILFLVVFTIFAYMLKKEYWKDVH